jgi:DNA-binding protein HU-beta
MPRLVRRLMATGGRAKKSCGLVEKLDPVGPLIDSESNFVATRPAPAKKTPVKKPAAKRPALAAPKPRAVAAPVVTLKTVFEQLGETHALPKKQAHALLADFVAAVTMQLEQGARIRISGLGTLEVKKRAERMGRNPATGEQIKIKASKKVAFRAAKELKRPSSLSIALRRLGGQSPEISISSPA